MKNDKHFAEQPVMKNPKAFEEQPITSLESKLAAAGVKAPATAWEAFAFIAYGKQPINPTLIQKIAAGGAGYSADTLTPSE